MKEVSLRVVYTYIICKHHYTADKQDAGILPREAQGIASGMHTGSVLFIFYVYQPQWNLSLGTNRN